MLFHWIRWLSSQCFSFDSIPNAAKPLLCHRILWQTLYNQCFFIGFYAKRSKNNAFSMDSMPNAAKTMLLKLFFVLCLFLVKENERERQRQRQRETTTDTGDAKEEEGGRESERERERERHTECNGAAGSRAVLSGSNPVLTRPPAASFTTRPLSHSFQRK